MRKYLLAGLALMLGTLSFAKGEIPAQLAKPQLHFLENNGQVKDETGQNRNDIDFAIKSDALSIFISNGKLSYQWYMYKDGRTNIRKTDIVLEGANPHTEIITEKKQQATTRFINEKENIVCRSFDKVTYKNVYNGIDWVLYIKDGMLEYDFVVHEGAKVSDIKLAFDGASQLKLKKDGSVLAVNPVGSITQLRPVSFTTKGDAVASSYKLNKKMLTFNIAPYSGTLVIDPVLEWATYYGGTANDRYYCIASDNLGHVYTAGHTASTSIATNNTTHQGGTTTNFDGFVSKFDVAGNLIWTTYYGTGGEDEIRAIAVDGANAVYIGGICDTVDYGAAFVAKLSTAGDAISSVAISGDSSEVILDICCGTSGDIYICGETKSITGISTLGSYQSVHSGGGSDGFIARLDTQLSVVWCTYYGGTGGDNARAISTDMAGHVYVAGFTESGSGISTIGTSQPAKDIGADAFLAQFNTSNGYLTWGTYLGGEGQDKIEGVDVDNAGAVYIAGSSNSTYNISTVGAHQVVKSGFHDVIVGKYNSSGIKQWCTYYGGSSHDAVDRGVSVIGNKVVINGITSSSSNLLVTNGFQQTYGGGMGVFDAMVAKFNKNSGAFEWGSYYGGLGTDLGRGGITTDLSENIYITGHTTSVNAIAVNTNVQNAIAGGEDGFIAKINDCDPLSQPTVITGDVTVCAGSTQTYSVPVITNASLYIWTTPNGWTGNSYAQVLTVTAGTASGPVTLYAYNNCDTTAVITLNVTVIPAPNPVVTQTGNTLSTTTYTSYQWYLDGLPIPGATNQTYIPSQPGNYHVVVTDLNGCSGAGAPFPVSVGNVTTQGALSIYPNPNTGVFTIKGSGLSVNNKVDIEVTNVAGRIVYRKQKIMKAQELSLDVTHIVPGIYTIKLTSGEHHSVMQFVKQ